MLIARALAQEPRFVVMDEPTASLDFGNQGKVMSEIRALAASGHGVLFTTHDPNHALRAADRAYLLREGTRLAEGPVAEVLNRDQLEALYRAPVERLVDPQTGAVAFSARVEPFWFPGSLALLAPWDDRYAVTSPAPPASSVGRRRAPSFGKPEFPAHDVGAEHQRHGLVIGVAPAHACAAHAAVQRNHQPLGRNVFERRGWCAADLGPAARPAANGGR